ncbi:putative fatty acyl-CoA reductase CG5065 [Zophobas morio]|uniref:putative fatty acyl-CoA reductase CG5065 n=1 Tax=Zophobas morio TaxID=2755281 RepID=UPI0030839E8C
MSDIPVNNENLLTNRIVDFFAKRTILVTGGSGFVGKVLIEKLLRSCTSLEKIYVIIRPRKGKTAEERLQTILNGSLFNCVKERFGPDIVKKVQAVPGDVSAPDLGLSFGNRRKLAEETEIIYHSAATVKFDEPLKSTVLLKVRGTKLMLELAKECKKLMVFSYISTVYCHEDQDIVFEKIYTPPADPHQIIVLCEWLDDESLSFLTKRLRGLSVNNYTFSKALAETLVAEEMDNLPVIIQRPSAILPIWKEPIPGWTDNVNGPAGVFIGAAKGVIRTMYARPDIFIDCLPVDVVANALIVSTAFYYIYKKLRIFNLTASEETERMGVTTEKVLEMGKDIINNKVAFNTVLWYPNGSLKQCRIHHYFDFFFFQLVPALLVDAILFIIGSRPFLFKIQKRIWRGYEILEYYVNRRWYFDNQLSKTARNLLEPAEKKMFKVDPEGFDSYDYFIQCTLACRRYIMKEPDEDIPAALRRMKMLRYLDILCKTIFIVGLFYYLSKWVLG